MIYELHKTRLHLLNFAVAPSARRLGVGQQLVQKLISRLSHQRRQEIVLEIRETNLIGQLFFQSQGFRATSVLRNHYSDSAEDAYLMQYRMNGGNETFPIWHGTNRIANKWYDLSETG